MTYDTECSPLKISFNGVLSSISEFSASSDVFDIIFHFGCHKKTPKLLQKLLRDLIMRLQEITASSVLRHVAQYKHGLVKGRELKKIVGTDFE